MRRFAHFLCFLFLATLLISCAAIKEKYGGGDEIIVPGDKLGKMTVEQGSPPLPYPNFWYFCDYMPDELQPYASTRECEVPQMSGMTVQFGWLAKESHFQTNWDAMTWDLNIDGHAIDLEAFEWQESDYIAHGENNKSRLWLIDLKNISPGAHVLQLTQTFETEVDDGFKVYQPGSHVHVVHFNVLKKKVYPRLTKNAMIGQNPFSSQAANLDFLLYLPRDYGKDPQKEWPMIVYLHGAPLRGSTLELLKEAEPLPKKLADDLDFPFIVLSPLGDGGYEFWAKDEMTKPLFTLLDEVQKNNSIDKKRIYLTGNDMGGNGVWAIGLQKPAYFAALAPVAGYARYPFEVPENICDIKDTPVWAFHGERDPFVPVEVEQAVVDALNACGGSAQITVSPDMKNDVPYKVYANPELYDWFMSKTLK
jgi:hypothetical protein